MDMKQSGLEQEAGHEYNATPLVPAVDIVEDGEAIIVIADLPGVTRENLAIGVDGDTLTVEGKVALGESGALQRVYAEIRVPHYKRSFVLGRDLDTANISASLQQGVLTLRVPKREQAKPRRIEVKAL
ncbi:MAG TPA: Hsp20/alpha crystallin family protein [Usitatibacter sp.]|nr:Hsp20/alpha crystallin family protein [Usitatibacter sp.]